jgi:hypothetical protein
MEGQRLLPTAVYVESAKKEGDFVKKLGPPQNILIRQILYSSLTDKKTVKSSSRNGGGGIDTGSTRYMI